MNSFAWWTARHADDDCAGAGIPVEETTSLVSVPVAQLKPKTIVFADRPAEEVLDASTGFMRFEDWARGKPCRSKFLSLYPGYNEPNVEVIVDGLKKRYREKLHMYVAQARFVLPRPAASLDLASFVDDAICEKIDPAIKHRSFTWPRTSRRPERAQDRSQPAPAAPLVRGQCDRDLHSFHLQARRSAPTGIALANKIRERSKQISDTLEFDSELALLSPAEIADAGVQPAHWHSIRRRAARSSRASSTSTR